MITHREVHRIKRNIKKFTIINLSSIIILLVPAFKNLSAQQEIWAKITTGAARQRIKLGIETFKFSQNHRDFLVEPATILEEVIRDDLIFSLYFEIIRPQETERSKNPNSMNNYLFWQKLGAQVVLAGEMESKKKTTLRIQLLDVYRKKLIATKTYEISANLRWLAHKVSDDIIKILTGEEGINQTQIVFSRRIDNAKELAVIDYDGYNLKQLTNTRNLNLFPAWSTDGKKIAFSSYDKYNLNICTLNLKNQKVEVFFNKVGLNTTPAFSPNGKEIAFSASFDGNPEIYIMDISGKDLRRLTYSNAMEISPSFSPSGDEIVFVSDRTGSPQIYIMNKDGSNVRRLTYEGTYNTSPEWSPRGDLILYVSRVGNNNQIFVIDPQGDNFYQLTNTGNNEEPSWSPDGLHIVFSSNREGSYEIYQMHWDGTGVRRLTNLGGCYSPSWSPRIKQ
jgi:TolB protein